MVPQKRKATTTSSFKPPRPLSAKTSLQPHSTSTDDSYSTVKRTSDPLLRDAGSLVKPDRRSHLPSSSLASSSSGDDTMESEASQIEEDDSEEDKNQPPLIPAQLLTKLFHHFFTDKDTRIGAQARVVAGKYLETFVREAIARAAYERGQSAKEKMTNQGGSRISRGEQDFLEVSEITRTACPAPAFVAETQLRLKIWKSWRHSFY